MDLVKSVWKATLIKRAAEICFSFLQMLVVSSNFASVGFQFYQAGNYVHWTLTNTENKKQVEYKFKKAFKKVTCKRRGICSKARLPTGQLCSSTSVQTRSETISFSVERRWACKVVLSSPCWDLRETLQRTREWTSPCRRPRWSQMVGKSPPSHPPLAVTT